MSLQEDIQTLYRRMKYHDHRDDGATIETEAIEDAAITNAKLANMAVNTVKGRITAGTGVPEDLSQANLRTIIGAGSGNGLDADKLDGSHSTAFAVAAKGVTNGDSHDHVGGDGAQIDHVELSNIGTYDHPTLDSMVTTGWIPAGTWTYVSASTFTVSGDVRTTFPIGTKLMLTQTTVKYFYVIATSYSAPNTTVTVTAGTDYTLANAAITSPNYSYVENPQGFPTSFAYTPALTSSGASFAYTYQIGTFSISKGMCHMVGYVKLSGAPTGTTTNVCYINAPVASKAYATNPQNIPVTMILVTMGTGGLFWFGVITQASTSIILVFAKSGAGAGIVAASQLTTNSEVLVNTSYMI